VTSSSDANGNTTTYAYNYVRPGGSVGLLTGTTRPAVGLYAPGTTPTTSTITNRYDPTTYWVMLQIEWVHKRCGMLEGKREEEGWDDDHNSRYGR